MDSILKHMCQALSRHEDVSIQRFGRFSTLSKPERIGRNPKTGEEKPITARRILTFRASGEMRQRVEKGRDTV
jgi:integration host factor subunit alpha